MKPRKKTLKKTQKNSIIQIENERKNFLKDLNYSKPSINSESIIKTIIEKLISLTISKSKSDYIEKTIPKFCFDKLKNSINNFIELNFISHDIDDYDLKEKKEKTFSKSFEKIKINNNLFENLTYFDLNNSCIQDSLILNKIENYDEFKMKEDSFFILDILTKKNKRMSVIDIKNRNQIVLEKKIFFDNFVDTNYKNFWDDIQQPFPKKVDRDASSLIKYSQISIDKLRRNNTINEKIELNNFKSKIIKKNKNPKIKKIKINNNQNISENKNNKKYIVIDYPSYNLNIPVVTNQLSDEELNKLRIEREEEIKQKKIEKQKEIEKEKERIALEKQKEFEKNNKKKKFINFTTDVKGNIVNIKPLSLNDLINEFQDSNSKLKHLDKILGENPLKNKDIDNIDVEKNLNIEENETEIKNNIIKKENKNKNNNKKLIKNVKKFSKNNLLDHQKNIQEILKLNENLKYATGSNFNLLIPEIGVNYIENSKFKSGGKDFYKKFHKYSLENFEMNRNKTYSNFFINKYNNNSIRNSVLSTRNINNINHNINLDNDFSPPKSLNNFYKKNSFLNLEPSNSNNLLHIKTDNLQYALSNLDLINDDEIKTEFYKTKNFFKTRNKNLTLNNLTNKENIEKNNLTNINQFTRTLMGNKNWGISNIKLNNNQNDNNKFNIINKIHKKNLKSEIPFITNRNNFNSKIPRDRTNNKFPFFSPIKTEINFFREKKKKKKLKEENDFVKLFKKNIEQDEKILF